ncbi:SDR family oxidoreductase [Edaphobacter sp. HDX4]|uniref:SDR family oxidoreductase n=1 Tax=Edaphobacter sp. HDX4 TaxID=2794064 RepID=UPI002FE66466
MKIVVIGGTGLIGKKLVSILQQQGHDAVAASPSSGVNTLTGAGLADAFKGAQVVVDVSNSPSFEETAVLNFFSTSARNIAAAELAAGVQHHVALSVVGADRMAHGGYMRAKVAQEGIIKDSGVPFTILRATQFFEFLAPIADVSLQDGAVHLPSALMQPVAAADVSAALADVATSKPVNGTLELTGPEKLPMAELVKTVLSAKKDLRTVVADPKATYFGYALDDSTLNPDSATPRIAPTRFEDWLRQAL